MLLEKGKRYRAKVRLSGFFERNADNNVVAKKFAQAGFAPVVVTGSGSDRVVEGVWPHSDREVDLPKQVVEAQEISATETAKGTEAV